MRRTANTEEPPERTGEAFELGERLTVVGERLRAGAAAPAFTLDWLAQPDGATSQVRLSDTSGSKRLLNVINSIDTPVCRIETRSWEDRLAEQAAEGEVQLYTISMDLPFALAARGAREQDGTGHLLLSAHRSERFGRDYGVLVKEWRLLQRAVFVIDRHDRLAHVEYVADQMAEPDYQAALTALAELP
ncbi:peroxiredoxin [Kitasatospora sp. GAS204B]|uniref:thiol peroxidase n=1 Tax=unclassified Kitasatospora TaxID=2633591 RepID=UPI002475A1FD|nr:redoxin family protein [Kitasatospora sp. GAS204B]MDH6117510.1 thiol peroxidase [Kitasatospora sp. GAS204B]